MNNSLNSMLIAVVGVWCAAAGAAEPGKLPRLVDLGADKCIPCKAMAPILKDLKADYAGRMDVEFIDVWKNPDAGKAYRIKLIPTQIFFDATGKERFRHEGFFGKEDILAKWKELGVDLKGKPATATGDKGADTPPNAGSANSPTQSTNGRPAATAAAPATNRSP